VKVTNSHAVNLLSSGVAVAGFSNPRHPIDVFPADVPEKAKAR
jgi:hypothetical protein